MPDNQPKVVKDQEILSRERHELRLPAGTPFGIAILGAARFSAMRRVFEQAERAALAKASFHDAQGAIADAITRREASFEQLNHLDTIRKNTADRIQAAYDAERDMEELARLRRQLEKMEVENQIHQLRAARGGPKTEDRFAPSPSEEEEILAWFAKVPNFVKHAEAAKAEIIKNAGGE